MLQLIRTPCLSTRFWIRSKRVLTLRQNSSVDDSPVFDWGEDLHEDRNRDTLVSIHRRFSFFKPCFSVCTASARQFVVGRLGADLMCLMPLHRMNTLNSSLVKQVLLSVTIVSWSTGPFPWVQWSTAWHTPVCLTSITVVHRYLYIRVPLWPPQIWTRQTLHPVDTRMAITEIPEENLPSLWWSNNPCAPQYAAIQHTQLSLPGKVGFDLLRLANTRPAFFHIVSNPGQRWIRSKPLLDLLGKDWHGFHQQGCLPWFWLASHTDLKRKPTESISTAVYLSLLELKVCS